MAAFSGRIKSGFENVRYLKTGATVDYADPVDTSSPVFIRDLTSGTAANQANIFYRSEVTIASAGNFVVDLVGGLSDVFGTQINATSLVSLMIINRAVDDSAASNTTNITLTTTLAGVFSGTTPALIIKPGGLFQIANTDAGGLCAVTATTADTVTLTNAAGASAKVQICAIARG